MVLKINCKKLFFLGIFLLIVSNTNGFSIVLSSYIKYLSYFLFLLSLAMNLYQSKNRFFKIITCLMLTLLLSLGIIVQEIDIYLKIYLIFSNLLIAMLFSFSGNMLTKTEDLKDISYLLLLSIAVTTFLCVINSGRLFSGAVEGVLLEYGFNGGLGHKNYFGIVMFLAYSFLHVYNKIYEKTNVQIVLKMIQFFLLLSCNSRTVYILVLLFWLIIYLNERILSKIKISNLFKYVAILLSLILVYFVLSNYISNSASYQFRFRGLLNYYNYYKVDFEKLLLGNPALGYSRANLTYTDNIRSVTGWDGTLELAALSILLKSGYVGIAVYFWMFINFVASNKKNAPRPYIFYSILGPVLLSTFAENFIVNLNMVFMPIVFILFQSPNLYVQKKESIP